MKHAAELLQRASQLIAEAKALTATNAEKDSSLAESINSLREKLRKERTAYLYWLLTVARVFPGITTISAEYWDHVYEVKIGLGFSFFYHKHGKTLPFGDSINAFMEHMSQTYTGDGGVEIPDGDTDAFLERSLFNTLCYNLVQQIRVYTRELEHNIQQFSSRLNQP